MASSNADIFGRLRFFQEESSNPDEPQENRPNPATSRVKRCLFGRGDPEENIRFAKKELEKSLQDSKKRWNFDFESERPLDGRYQWHSPYPRITPRTATPTSSVASKENSNPSHPCSKPTSESSSDSSSHSPVLGSNEDQRDSNNPDSSLSLATASAASENISLPGALPSKTSCASSSSSTSSEHAGSSSSQRTTRQSSINRKNFDLYEKNRQNFIANRYF